MNAALSQVDAHLRSPRFTMIMLIVIALSYQFVDLSLSEYFHHWEHPHWMKWLHMYTQLGKGIYSILLFLGILILCKTVWDNPVLEKNSIFLLQCLIVSGLLCDILKIGLGRARPVEWFQHHQFGFHYWQWHANYWSFPSGHSTTIAALMMGIALCYPRSFFICLMTLLSVSLSRVVLTAHYLSDTLIGMYLGCLTSLLLYHVKNLPQLRKPLLQRSGRA